MVPSQPKKKLAFCHDYQERGCCDRKLTKSIKAAVDALVDPACSNCYAVVADYKCAECSPDSGTHLAPLLSLHSCQTLINRHATAMFHEGLKSQIRFCWVRQRTAIRSFRCRCCASHSP
jgi:hypothetical protein